MRLSWLFGSHLLQIGAGRFGRRSKKAALLRVRQLERRRVLDAAAASVVVTAVTSTDLPAPPLVSTTDTSHQPLTTEAAPPQDHPAQPESGAQAAAGAAVNVPPFLIAQVDQNVTEGVLLDLSGLGGAPPLALFIDSDLADTHTATVDWGDGSPVENATVFPGLGSGAIGGTHTYADQGTYTVTVFVTDNNGGSDVEMFDVIVAHVAPTGNFSNNGPVVEGSSATVSFTNQFDPSSADAAAGFHYAYDLDNDGTFDVGDGMYAGSVTSASENVPGSLLFEGPGNPGDYTVRARIIDKDGQFTDYTTTISVTNAAPTLTNITGDTVNENGVATITASILDPGATDVFSVQVDWLDGSTATISGLGAMDVSGTIAGTTYQWIAATRNLELSHQYLDDGLSNAPSDTYNVSLNVSDDEMDATGPYLAPVIVNNVPPALVVATMQNVLEGNVLDLSGLDGAPPLGLFFDPGTLDTHTATVDWGDGSAVENGVIFGGMGAGAIGGTHIYADNGLYKVTVTVTDKDGDADTKSFFVQVGNVAPTLVVPGPQMVVEGNPLSITNLGTITDPGFDNPANPIAPPTGSLETFTYWVDWADGNIDTGTATIDDVGGIFDLTNASFDGMHTYADDDTYTVIVRVADDDMTANFVGGVNGIDFVEQQLTVTVKNDVPELVNVTGSTIEENGVATVTATVADDGSDVFSVDVDWQDGTSDTVTGLGLIDTAGTIGGTTYTWTAATRQLQLNHQYLDDGTSPGNGTTQDNYGVVLTVHDDDMGAGAPQVATVIVQNVAPQITDPTNITISENGTAVLTTTITDPGTLDTFSVDVNWQDGASDTITGLGLTDAAGTIGGTTYSWTAATRQLQLSHQLLDDGASPGNGTAQDDYHVTLSAHDDDLGTGAAQTATVTVQNVAPQNSDPADITISENGTAVLTTTITDPGTLDVFSLDVNWQDGSSDTISGLGLVDAAGTIGGTTYSWTAATRQLQLSHQYLDDGPSPGNGTTQDGYAVTLTTHDDDLGTGATQTVTVTVQNIAPSLTLSPVAAINENGIATVTGAYTDIGRLDAHTLTIDWGDPNNTGDSTFAIPAIRDAAGTPTLSVGAMFSSSTDPAVLTITSINAATGEVGFSVSHRYLDDGAAPGNGTTSDDSTILVTVMDDDGQSGGAMSIVTINNVAPGLALNAVPAIDENGVATLTGSYTDIGLLDAHTLTVDWGDPNNSVDSTFSVNSILNAAGMPTLNVNDAFNSLTDGAVLTITAINSATGQVSFSVAHQYVDDGLSPGNGATSDSSTIDVAVFDDDTGSITTGTTVLVHNVAPTISLNAVAMINENGAATLTGSFTDIGLRDGHVLTIGWDDPNDAAASTFTISAIRNASGNPTLSFGDSFNSSTDEAVLTITSINAATGQVGFSVTHQYLDDGPAPGNNTASDTSLITATIADDDSQSGNTSTSVLVKNVLPGLTVDGPIARNEGELLDLTGSAGGPFIAGFTDIGSLDLHMAQINWGDGFTDVGTVTEASGNGTIGGSHTYADDGVYLVTIRVADDDMGAFSNATLFNSGTIGVDYVEITFTVTVSNVAPSLTDTGSTNTVAEGQAFVLSNLGGSLPNMGVGLSDPGFDNPLNTGPLMPPAIGDPLAETFTGYTIDWGDGTADTPVTIVNRASGSPGTPTTALFQHAAHTYADNGVYTVRIRVADDNLSGNFASGANGVDFVDLDFQITVMNVDPTLTLPVQSATDINENGSISFNVDFSDPGFDNALNDNTPPNDGEVEESFTYDIDWGDGRHTVSNAVVSATPGGVGVPSAGSFGESHIYADDGIYTITVTIHDDDGGANVRTFQVTVHNVNPVIVMPLEGDEVNTQGITRIRFSFSDLGFDNLANPTPPPTGDQTHEAFTYHIDWGDGIVDVITISQVAAGSPLVIHSQTRVMSSDRVSGDEGIATTGFFDVEHRYTGPPDPLHPTADIPITITLVDDNGGTISDSIAIGNPGIEVINVAIDTTPDVPRLEFVPQQVFQVILDQQQTTPQSLQNPNVRVAQTELTLTSDRYLELQVISPEGKVVLTRRLKDEALTDLRALIATLPDNHYRIYLVRTDNNSRRLVLDVNVRGGRVVDLADDSEGTRDRPPTDDAQLNQPKSLDGANPFIEDTPQEQSQGAVDGEDAPVEQVSAVTPPLDVPAPDAPAAWNSTRLRWAVPLAGLAAVAHGGSWSSELDAAFHQADELAWKRLRRAGRVPK